MKQKLTNTFLHRKFYFHLSSLNIKSSILIAVSGGQDSLCLSHLISNYYYRQNRKIGAIYIDHQWTKNSLKHTKHIINLFKSLSIPLTVYQIKKITNSELEARRIRYQILIKHALINNYENIFTGHNNNDTIETLLNNLLRGSSLNGLTSFTITKHINKSISIARPLIHYTRNEISWFCRTLYLPTWSDITNYNYIIQRNRVRHELLPYLTNHFNPRIDYHLKKFLELCQNENEYIKENTIKLYTKSQHKTFVAINLNKIQKQHKTLQKRIVQLHFYYHFNQNIEQSTINFIIQMIQKKKYVHKINKNTYVLIIQSSNNWLYTSIKNFTNSNKTIIKR